MSHIPKFTDFLTESSDVSNKKIADVWHEVYGKNLYDEHPTIFKILKHRPTVDKRELKRIWDETYEEDIEEKYPEFCKKID